MRNKEVPDLAYLGICDRGKHIQPSHPYLWHHNILGLRNTVISPIYPLSLANFQLVMAIYDLFNSTGAHISIRTEKGEEIFYIDFEGGASSIDENKETQSFVETIIPAGFPTWTTVLVPFENTAVTEPGQYTIYLVRDEEEIPIGSIVFLPAEVPPLTDDRVAAIRSNPMAAQRVRMILECNKCGDKITAYCALEKISGAENRGYIWYHDLPELFECRCGKTVVNLEILRKNMHVFLGQTPTPHGNISVTRMYEKSALEDIRGRFLNLLDTDPTEEQVQQFIEEYPILLHQFSPQRILYKPPILSRYETDIVILNHKKELILIELEKPGKKLLKRDGGITAYVQHAFDQVTDWLQEIEQHRLAVLDCLDIGTSEVSKVRGVVIMGREHGYEEKHLLKLKWKDFGKVELLTYDDLLRNLGGLAQNINEL